MLEGLWWFIYVCANITKQMPSFFMQGACVKKLSGREKLDDNNATKQIVALLSAPLDKYKDIDTALKLSNYPRVMEYLNDGTHKEMANVIVQNIMKNKTCVSTAEKVCIFRIYFCWLSFALFLTCSYCSYRWMHYLN